MVVTSDPVAAGSEGKGGIVSSVSIGNGGRSGAASTGRGGIGGSGADSTPFISALF